MTKLFVWVNPFQQDAMPHELSKQISFLLRLGGILSKRFFFMWLKNIFSVLVAGVSSPLKGMALWWYNGNT